ncbi:MAG: transcriptional regulator [Xenophilus sp.]
MNKRELIEHLARRRDTLGLPAAQLAARSGLTERSIRNALGSQGNPQLSSLLALVEALDMELQLVPRGFGPALVANAEAGYRPVPTRVAQAVAEAAPPPFAPPAGR